MILRSMVRSILLMAVVFNGACSNRRDRAVLVGGGNQGSFTVKSEPNLTPPETFRTASTGPTTREVDQQQRIEILESRQRALQAEIERLKREKSN